MLSFYVIIGLLWTVYTLYRNSKSTKAHREHWFTAILFSFILWPFFMWNAYLNGFPQEDWKNLRSVQKGRKHTEETRKKMSEAKKRKPAKNRRPVVQYTKEGTYIREWPSITEAQDKLKVRGIGNVLTGRVKTAGGYIWKYKL